MAVGQGLIHREVPLKVSDRELNCLAENIYHESRGEPIRGQIAVAQVTINRVLHTTEFNSSICKVVHAKAQFSWTLDKTKKIKNNHEWQKAKALAQSILDGYNRIPNFNALYFHTTQIKPKWSRTKQIVARIGSHVFYA